MSSFHSSFRVLSLIAALTATATFSACTSQYRFTPDASKSFAVTETKPAPSPVPSVEVSPGAPSVKPTPTASPTPVVSPKPTAIPSPTPSPTVTVMPTPSPSPTATAKPTPTPKPTVTPKPTATPTPTPSPILGADAFVPPRADQVKVDMLFVVDNSGSMEDKQQLIANNFSQFITQFVKKGVDFHLGVITTDVYSSKKGRLYSHGDPERFLTRTSSSLEDTFGDWVNVGTRGSDKEQGLNSFLLATDPAMLATGGYNAGFIRPDALLSTIIVSDEDEDLLEIDKTPEDRIARVAARLAQLKATDSRGYRFDFVINLDESKPSDPIEYPLGDDINSYPNVYLKAADRFSSRKINIMGNFGNSLVDIGSDIIQQAQSEFKLSQPSVVGTVKVSLNGAALIENGPDGFIFHADRNTIELRGAALKNSPGSNLSIRYEVRK